jgi:hypothetical protein
LYFSSLTFNKFHLHPCVLPWILPHKTKNLVLFWSQTAPVPLTLPLTEQVKVVIRKQMKNECWDFLRVKENYWSLSLTVPNLQIKFYLVCVYIGKNIAYIGLILPMVSGIYWGLGTYPQR